MPVGVTVDARVRADSRKTKAQLLEELADLRARLARAEPGARSSPALQSVLLAALQKMPDGLAYFDADDRLVFCNDRYREIYHFVADLLEPGVRFENVVRATVDRGVRELSGEDPDHFVARRLAAHRAGAVFEHQFQDGRVIHTRDHLLDDGGRLGIRIDMTEQRRAEAALRESEAFARAVIDSSDDGVVVVDDNFRIALMNPSAERIFSCEAVEALGKRVDELFVPEEERDAHRRALSHFLETGVSAVSAAGNHMRFEAQRFDGTRFPAELSVGVTRRGDAPFFIWFVRDITERLRTQAALERSEANLRALMDHTQIALHLKRPDGRFILANRRYTEWTGRAAEDLMGRTNAELHGATGFMSRATIRAVREQEEEMLRTGSVVTREYELPMPDGELQYWEITKFPVYDPGGAIALIGSTGVEITERRRAEAEVRRQKMLMQAILDHTPVALTLLDSEGRFVLVNREFCRRYSFAEADVLGRTADDVFGDHRFYSAETRERMKHLRQAMIETAQPATDEWTVHYADGQPRIVSFTRFPILDVEGNLLLSGSTAIDVTDIRRAETALERSEANLRALMDHTQVVLILKDRNGRFILANRRYVDWCGLPAQTLLGRTNAEIHAESGAVSDVNVDDLDDQEADVLRTGIAVTREHELRRTGGEVENWIVTKFPVRDASGEIVALGTTGIEITETRRAEAALRRQDGLIRSIMDHTPVALTLWDAKGRFALANGEFYRRYGLTEAEVIGKTSAEIFGDGSRIDPDALATMQRLRETSLATGRPESAECVVRYADGSKHTVLSTRFPIRDEQGRILYSGSTVTDVTEMRRAETALRQSEATLRAVLDNLPSMVTLKQPGGRYLLANRAVEAAFGPVVGRSTDEVVAPQLSGRALQQERRVIESGRSETEEHVYERKGHATYSSVTKFPVRDAEGTLIGVGSIATDVTELKETQARLAQAQKMEAVGQLTGGIAHDFNNLLQVIIGNLSLLAERPLDREAIELIEAAGRAARRGAEVTHQLLAFGRRQTLRPRVVDIGELIGELAGLFRRALGGRTDVALELAYATWPVRVDPGQLQSALLNLCINGRDAMPEGGVLTIATRNVELPAGEGTGELTVEPGRYVVLSVADNGIGMTETVLAHALDPFFTTKEVGQGSGLGLSMVYGFIRQSGGDLRIRTALGRGTTVELYLPAVEPARRPAEIDRIGDETGGLKVLLVSETPGSTVGAMLEDLGCLVIRSGDLDTSFNALERYHPVDLLLIETGLGGVSDSTALTRALRTRNPGVAVVYVDGEGGRTGAAPVPSPQPAAIVLARPFDREALRDKIVEALTS